MELTMTNSFGFCELNEQEMMMVDGGISVWAGIGLTVAIVGCAWAAPIGLAVGVAAIEAGAAVAAGVGAGVATGGAIGLTSAGLVGKITGLY